MIVHDNSFGALRLMLAALVMYGHALYLGQLGSDPVIESLFAGRLSLTEIGVQGFFLLSGYLVLQSAERTPSVRQFFAKRALRIFPGLWFCLILTGPVLAGLVRVAQDGNLPPWSDAFGYVWRNLFLPRTQINVPGVFDHALVPGDLNGSLWTLEYELGCYILLGFFAWLGLTRPRSPFTWLLVAAIAGLYLHDVLRPEQACFFKTAGRHLGVYFFCGAAFALIPGQKLRRALTGPVALAIAIIFVLTVRAGWVQLAGPPCLALLLLWLAWHLPLTRFENWARGDYSYGLYIYAYPVQQGLAQAGLPRYGLLPYLLVTVALTLSFAVLSWHLVEKSALRLKSFSTPLVAVSVPAPSAHPAG